MAGSWRDSIGLRVTLRRIYDEYLYAIIAKRMGWGAQVAEREMAACMIHIRIDYLKRHFEQSTQMAITDGGLD